jgi:hypothetical protein
LVLAYRRAVPDAIESVAFSDFKDFPRESIMSDVALEKVLEKAKELTTDKQRRLIETLEKELRTAELRRIQGKYANVLSSSEEFALRKAEEIELEDRRRF